MKTLLLSLLLMGCAASSIKGADPVSTDNMSWTAIKLIDLPGEPVITKGDVSDDSASLVAVQTPGKTLYYRIDHKDLKLSVISAFDVGVVDPREVKTYARDVQMKVMYDQYVNVWRCRYSQAWSHVASRDLRAEGPLLLDVQSLNPVLQSFRLLIGIDSSTLEVVGLSGVSGIESMDEPYYTSSIDGMNRLFGLASRSTFVNRNFGYACAEAYFRRLPAYKRSLDTFEACTISTPDEKALSESADFIALSEKVSIAEASIGEYTAQAFDRQPVRKYNPSFDLSKIDSLIQTAVSGNGVGL